MFHPTRGGTRGGQNQFKWEDVKSDKDRTQYLGHSVRAAVGRWQKNQDLGWYAKDRRGKFAGLSEEEKTMLNVVKMQERDMLLEHIGEKERKPRATETGIDSVKMKELLARGAIEDNELESERITGLGYAPSRKHELDPSLRIQEETALPIVGLDADSARKLDGASSAHDTQEQSQMTEKELKKLHKHQRKIEKRLKKQAKKDAKKQEKAEISSLAQTESRTHHHSPSNHQHISSQSISKSSAIRHRHRHHGSCSRSPSPSPRRRRRRRHGSRSRSPISRRHRRLSSHTHTHTHTQHSSYHRHHKSRSPSSTRSRDKRRRTQSTLPLRK